MATFLALKRGIAAATPFSKLFAPISYVSAAPCVPRWFNTDAFSYDGFNRSVDADRYPDSAPFSKVFVPIISVSAASGVPRWFNTNSSHEFSYDDFNRSIDAADLRSDSTVSCHRDNDVFSASRRGGLGTRKAWNANENEERVILRFDMPGLDKQNVKISVEQNCILIINAEKEKEKESEDDEPPRRYSSRIDLLSDVYKVEEITAEMKNGVLKITVPKVKTEERKDARQIQVE